MPIPGAEPWTPMLLSHRHITRVLLVATPIALVESFHVHAGGSTVGLWVGLFAVGTPAPAAETTSELLVTSGCAAPLCVAAQIYRLGESDAMFGETQTGILVFGAATVFEQNVQGTRSAKAPVARRFYPLLYPANLKALFRTNKQVFEWQVTRTA